MPWFTRTGKEEALGQFLTSLFCSYSLPCRTGHRPDGRNSFLYSSILSPEWRSSSWILATVCTGRNLNLPPPATYLTECGPKCGGLRRRWYRLDHTRTCSPSNSERPARTALARYRRAAICNILHCHTSGGYIPSARYCALTISPLFSFQVIIYFAMWLQLLN